MRIQMVTAALGLTAILMSGCGQQGLWQARQKTQAPTSQQQTGWLLEGVQRQDVLQILKDHPTATFRSLNEVHGLYEIYGVNPDTIDASKLPTDARWSHNQYFVRNTSGMDWRTQMLHELESAPENPVAGCIKSDQSPTVALEAVGFSGELNGQTVQRGTELTLSAAKSQPSIQYPSKLQETIAVLGPELSSYKYKLIHSPTLKFTPKDLGLYTVAAIVRDSRNVCALKIIRFVITDNVPFKKVALSAPDFQLDKFTHLADVNAVAAWDISQGKGVTIAVIDTGADYNHPELNGNIAINKGEIPDNGIDDDGNGFVDDVVGYDFLNQDASPYDDDGHGTHVSGLAAAMTFGMAKQAKILPVKALNGIGGDTGTIAAAIMYAVDRGAGVINMSLGGYSQQPPQAMVDALNYAESKGAVVVIAAGNGDPTTGLGVNTDQKSEFPADLPNANIISVAATDRSEPLAPYSNYGMNSVDIAAPGGMLPGNGILSLAYENSEGVAYQEMIGTSMATPIVAGLAAQVRSLNPTLNAEQVKDLILKNGTEVSGLKGVIGSGKVINALATVEAAQQTQQLY